MKTLSVKQPWASLICAGIKDVENRSWKPAQVPGRILIHASSAKVPRNFLNKIPEEMVSEISNHVFFGNLAPLNELPTSAIVGYVTVTGFEEGYVDSAWSDGPGVIKWKLEDAWMFDEPILNVKGKLNLFDYDDIDEDNLPPAHKVDLKSVEVKDKDELVVPCYDLPFKEIGEGKYDSIQLFFTDDLMMKLSIVEKDGPRMKTFKTMMLTCGNKYQRYELTENTNVYAVPSPDDEAEPYRIMYHNGEECSWLTVDLEIGKKLGGDEYVTFCGGMVVKDPELEKIITNHSDMNIIQVRVDKTTFQDIVSGKQKSIEKEIKPNTKGLYCLLDENGEMLEKNGVVQIRKYDAIQFINKMGTYTCALVNADIEFLVNDDSEIIRHTNEIVEDYDAVNVVYYLGDEIK